MRLRLPARKAPLGLGAFLALPIFFAALMAASLAIESPRVVEWQLSDGRLARIFHEPSSANEWHIWLLALVPPLLLVLASLGASYLPLGIYITCVAAVVDAFALTLRLHRWEVHHTSRFPKGQDLITDNTTSSLFARGEWEHDAAQTVRSLEHYTIGLAIASAVLAAFLAARRRRAPAIGVPSASQQTGGAPTSTKI